MTQSAADIIDVGVFGVGSLGAHHARIYSSMDGVRLAGVFDVDRQRAAEIARLHGTEPFTDMDALAERVTAASVAVPTDKHFAVFNDLRKHGVHMLMEKPIAALTSEAEAMVTAAADANLILQIGHVERFNPVLKFLESNLTSPTFIDAARLAPYPPQRPGLLPRGTEVSVVLDLMIHDLDIILHIVHSPIKDIRATGATVLSQTEDIANARILFENGCVANLTSSRISLDRMRRIQVFEGDAYAVLDYNDQSGTLIRRNGESIEATEVPVVKGDALTGELLSFIECVRHSKTPVVSGEHGTAALQVAVDICHIIASSPS